MFLCRSPLNVFSAQEWWQPPPDLGFTPGRSDGQLQQQQPGWHRPGHDRHQGWRGHDLRGHGASPSRNLQSNYSLNELKLV